MEESWSPQMTEWEEIPQATLGSGRADESIFTGTANEDLQMFKLTLS